MSRRLKVEWSESAVHDLERIADNIAEDSTFNAVRVLDRLERAVEKLASSPRRGRLVPELLALDIRTLRELVLAPWRVLYRVEVGRVLIMGVLDSRRDLESTLFSRLTSED